MNFEKIVKLGYGYETLKSKQDLKIEEFNECCYVFPNKKPKEYYIRYDSLKKKPKKYTINELRQEFPKLVFGKKFNPIVFNSNDEYKLHCLRVELNNHYSTEELKQMPKLREDVDTYGLPREDVEYDVRLLEKMMFSKTDSEEKKSLFFHEFYYFNEDYGPYDELNGFGKLGHKPQKYNMFKTKFFDYKIKEHRLECFLYVCHEYSSVLEKN